MVLLIRSEVCHHGGRDFLIFNQQTIMVSMVLFSQHVQGTALVLHFVDAERKYLDIWVPKGHFLRWSFCSRVYDLNWFDVEYDYDRRTGRNIARSIVYSHPAFVQ